MTRVEDLSRLSPHERLQLLKLPPNEDDVDPTAIPHEHRLLFLAAVREMSGAGGDVSPEEKETLELLEQLTR
jgi:hypothetical protein